MYNCVLESRKMSTWIPFTDLMPKGKVYGWVKFISYDSERNFASFRIVMARQDLK